EVPELRGVLRQTLGADDEEGNNDEDDDLESIDAEHGLDPTNRACVSRSPPRAHERMPRMDELQVERVLRAVESIPAGSALPYGRVGRAAGASARFVGRVMSVHGSAVAWWRVPNARGDFPPPLRARARPHLREEDTPLREDGRIDLRLAAPHP